MPASKVSYAASGGKGLAGGAGKIAGGGGEIAGGAGGIADSAGDSRRVGAEHSSDAAVKHLRFVDARLWPAATLAWVLSWVFTKNPANPTMEVSGVVLVVAVIVTAAGMGIKRSHQPRVEGRHRRYPAGSASAAIIVALLISAATTTSAIIHTRTWTSSAVLARCQQSCTITVTPTQGSRASGNSWRTPTEVHIAGARQAKLTLITRKPLAHPWGQPIQVHGKITFDQAPPNLGTMRHPRISATPTRTPGSLQTLVTTLRHNWKKYLDENHHHANAWLLGMSVGDTSQLSGTERQNLRDTSTAHLVAISGTHLAIVTATLNVLLPGRGKIKASVILSALLVMVLLVGATASVLRAASMAAVIVLAGQVGRRGQGHSTLALVVIAWLIVDPWMARSWGFTLSVAATAGVLTALPPGTKPMTSNSWGGKVKRKIGDLGRIAFYAHAFTAALVLAMSGTTSIWAVPANILVAPAVGITTLGALAGVLSATCKPALTVSMVALAQLGASWISYVTSALALLPGAHLENQSAALVACTTMVVAAGWSIWRYRKRVQAALEAD
ncbi:MAG: ComEC/Rec2 family competence protein [Actinomycetaceae bacterium]|nr:ComEC/Rec2 family competence protein [Actinomycetaceae bacterium]